MKFQEKPEYFEKKQEIINKLLKIKADTLKFFLKKLGLQHVQRFTNNLILFLKPIFALILTIVVEGTLIYLSINWLIQGAWYLRIISLGCLVYVIDNDYKNNIINWIDHIRTSKLK